MRVAFRRAAPDFLLAAVLLCAGCAGAPPASVPLLRESAFLSRDGVMRYRIPTGWFDATADSQAVPRAVFLVRGDYAGSISVKELHVDQAARRDLIKTGLVQLAKLAAALETGSSGGVVARDPESIRVKGNEGARYDLEFGSGDRVRTVLVDTGERFYAVAALVNAAAPERAAGEIFAAQQAFVQALSW